MNKEKGTHLVSEVYIFQNRLGELGCFGRASLAEAVAFPGSCLPNIADSA